MSKTCGNFDCPLRQVNGGESVDDGLPVVMFEQPFQYAEELFLCAIYLLGLAFVSVALAGCVVFVAMHFFGI